MRLGRAGFAAVTAAALLVSVPGHGMAAGADVGAVDGTFTFSPGVGPFPQVVAFSFAGGCPRLPAPTYVDVPGDSGAVSAGACGAVTMFGTLTSLSCAIGTGSGTISVTEPSGDTVNASFVMLVTGSLALLTMPLTFRDDGGTGPAVAVFEMTPPVTSNPPPDGICVTSETRALGAGVLIGLHT